MIVHAHVPGEELTLCGRLTWSCNSKRTDKFDEQIRVSCPTCRHELDKRALEPKRQGAA